MNREETKTIIRAMMSSYPNYKPQNLSETVDVWQAMLDDVDYKLISIALKSYIRTDRSGFAPSIGQLMDYVSKLTEKESMTDAEAWAVVKKAISNSAYDSVDEFAKLPPVIQRAIGRPNVLKQMALSTDFNEGVESSNFKRTYRALAEKEKEYNKMSADAQMLIGKLHQSGYELPKKQETIQDGEPMLINDIIQSKIDKVRKELRG